MRIWVAALLLFGGMFLDFDGSQLIRDDREKAVEKEQQPAKEAAKEAAPADEGAQPASAVDPVKVPRIERPSAAPDPRAGRRFRQITPDLPLTPGCPDGTQRPCVQDQTPYPAGSPPLGGYYYGYFQDPADGKLKYGKLYLPHYGELDGPAHNDPPPGLPRIPEKKTSPIEKSPLKKRR